MPNAAAYALDYGTGYYQDEGCPDGEFPSCLLASFLCLRLRS